MRIILRHFLCVFAALAVFYTTAHASTPFSKYGVIQNVQNYSTNPYWNSDSPYNNRMPQPVYATGPDVTTDECQRIVTSLVTVQCMNANNCIDTQLSDIRPAIILQLSRMTGGNYATACAGYLDSIFNEYVSQYANAAPKGVATSFPTASVPNPNTEENQIQIQNPFAPKVPDWATEMQERKQELQNLQTQTGSNNYGVKSAAFPTTYADLSFSERLENTQKGYEPFKDMKAYRSMDIESQEEYLARIENNSNGSNNNNSSTSSQEINREEMMKKIVAVLKEAKK